jgi:serine/threonine protein phosphatase 1
VVYAIGDIHGHSQKLRDLLAQLAADGMTNEDFLVFVGDYVDRGPDTKGVIQTLIELKKNRPNTVFLRGNHEQMMLDARKRFNFRFDSDNPMNNSDSGIFWFTEGGTQTLQSYGSIPNHRWFEIVPEEHWDFIRATQFEFDYGAYKFVHAGVLPPGKKWDSPEFACDPRLWIRYEFIASDADFGGKTIIFGHTPTRDGRPLRLPNKIAIDTGAGTGGPLTAVRLPEVYAASEVRVWQA